MNAVFFSLAVGRRVVFGPPYKRISRYGFFGGSFFGGSFFG